MDEKTGWTVIRSHLELLFDMEEGERSSYLEKKLADQPEIRKEVESLLRADHAAGDLLEVSAADRLPNLMAELSLEDPTPSTPLGSRIGSWTLHSILGEGGMGRVFLVEREGDGFTQKAALKIIHQELESTEARRLFRAERALLARLTHPSIALFIEGGWTEDNQPFVVMEYVEGQTLDRHCGHYQLDLEQRIRLVIQVCEVVEFAHHRLVIHQDLKPSNVLVTPEGNIKLLDFGIAKVVTAPVGSESRPSSSPLTPAYSSPEQRSGAEVTTATDVFSLGVIAWELLTGTRPVTGAAEDPSPDRLPPSHGVAKTAVGVTNTSPSLQGQLKGDLDAILLKATDPHPENRYAGPGELAADLEKYLQGLPVSAREISKFERFRKLVNRHRATALASLAAFLFMLVGGSSSAYLAHRATHERNIAQREASRAEGTMSLLQSLLSASAKDREEGSKITVRELLSQAETRLDGQLDADPRARIEILAVLTHVYRSLRLYAEAAEVAERGLQLALEELGEDDVEVALARDRLGLVLVNAGRPEQAIGYLNLALDQLEAEYGEQSPEVLTVLRHISYVPGIRRKHGTKALRQRILEGERILANGQDSVRLAQALNDHARTLHFAGEGERAIQDLNEALHMRIRLDLPRVEQVVILNNRAMAELGLGRGLEAEASTRAALKLMDQREGGEDLVSATTWSRLALALVLQDRLDEGREAAAKAVALRTEHFPENHPFIGSDLRVESDVLCRMGEYEAAEQGLSKAKSLLSATYPEDGWRIAEVQNTLGLCLLRQGRQEEALELIRQSQERILARLGEATPVGREGAAVLRNLRARQ